MDTEQRLLELSELRAYHALTREADEVLERAQRDRLPLIDSIELMLPVLLDHTGASAVWMNTLDEDLVERDFFAPEESAELTEHRERMIDSARKSEPFTDRSARGSLLSCRLDVAGDYFGAVGLSFAEELDASSLELRRVQLDAWCEVVDNYLIAISRARHKHKVTMAIGHALKHPVLEQGISESVAALGDEVAFDDLLLVYETEQGMKTGRLHYRVIQQHRLVYCSFSGKEFEPEDALLEKFGKLLDGDLELLRDLGLTNYREQALIIGAQEERVIGRLIVGRGGSDFNTFDRDLLERMADYLRHRIVDFNREWRTLANYFPEAVILKLLREEGYRERFLTPREREVAILYCDISGFTRLSEQVLREPTLIGRFIDEWSSGVVAILWELGGVFDKMIGDCVIGIWGPPLFDQAADECCRRALTAAQRIRDFTRSVTGEFPALRAMDEPAGVAIGLNYCPAMVGFFGPNDDFTCFSSGMNNTARLQSLAERDEILCTVDFVDRIERDFTFGDERQAEVKNVAQPLRFRALA